MRICREEKLKQPIPAKRVGLFSKVTSHRTDNEITKQKYEINHHDEKNNFTVEHHLDDTEDISRANTNDSERGGQIPMTAREEGKYQ